MNKLLLSLTLLAGLAGHAQAQPWRQDAAPPPYPLFQPVQDWRGGGWYDHGDWRDRWRQDADPQPDPLFQPAQDWRDGDGYDHGDWRERRWHEEEWRRRMEWRRREEWRRWHDYRPY